MKSLKILPAIALLSALMAAPEAAIAQTPQQYDYQDERQQGNDTKKTFSWGANLALNTAVMENYYGFPNFGAGAAIFALIPISKSFNFQPELTFQNYRMIQTSTKNSPHQNQPLENGDNIYRITQYLTIPMLFQFDRFGGRNMWFINLGPEIKYCLANRDQHTNTDHKTNYLPQTNRFILALNLGAGMHVPVAPKLDFLWELRLSGDLTSASKNEANLRHASLDLKVGILYKL